MGALRGKPAGPVARSFRCRVRATPRSIRARPQPHPFRPAQGRGPGDRRLFGIPPTIAPSAPPVSTPSCGGMASPSWIFAGFHRLLLKFSALDARAMLPGVTVRVIEDATRGVAPRRSMRRPTSCGREGIEIVECGKHPPVIEANRCTTSLPQCPRRKGRATAAGFTSICTRSEPLLPVSSAPAPWPRTALPACS